MALFNSIRLGASAGGGGDEVGRSLRFNDDDSAYLTRTPSSAGNRKKWTFSAWIKRSNLGGSAGEQRIFGGNANASHIFISTDDKFRWDLSNEQSGSASATLSTNPVFRDPSAWYHLVCALDTDNSTANNRMKMYVNGTEVTSFVSRTNPSSGYATNAINNNTLHTLGYRTSGQGSAGMEFDGYMAEVNFVDGQQYDPSYFGETDALTGQWNPKKYVGSYGTNGFYLNFLDNSGTTATTLGKDSSGLGNNVTPVNFSVAAGAGNDSLEDTPTNNFCTLNPLAGRGTGFLTSTNGNLDFAIPAGGTQAWSSFQIPTSGKWYSEWVFTTVGSGVVGVGNVEKAQGSSAADQLNGINMLSGEIRVNDSATQSSLTAFGNNDIIGVKVDRDAGTVAFTINGSAVGNAENISSMNAPTDLVFRAYRNASGGSTPTGSVNYGQRPFSNLPTGYKALNSANLPDPTILLPNNHFETVLWTGNSASGASGTTQTISGLNFGPDWLWIKRRDGTSVHSLNDTVRGVNKQLNSEDTAAETSYSGRIGTFNSDGFILGADGDVNYNGATYVGWNWNAGGSTVTNTDGTISAQVRANTSAGFSIVSYIATGSAGATVGHGLGVKPDVIITKRRSDQSNWGVYHSTLGAGKSTFLNTTNAAIDNTTYYNDTEPTSTVFTLGGSNESNGANGDTYIGYFFSEVAGYSKFGKYTGNGNADGTFVFTGFRPAWIMTKRTDSSSNWIIHDNKRDSYNVIYGNLIPNSGLAESTGSVRMDFVSNGFKHRNSDGGAANNISGATYIYLAFAESPFKNSRAR